MKELPHHLQQYFVYCAIYPEGSLLFRDDIIRMWVAEGFIDEQDGQLLKDIAEEHYDELIYRNLLQPDYLYADLSQCRVHDLLRRLACCLSKEECFVGDPESIGVNIMSKLQRISVFTEKDMVVFPSMDKEQYKVRTWRTQYGKSLRVDNTIFRRLPYI
uniref:Disease resistance protein winged helix domain-containing protein n=1 Tax=Arundo donax TaxID=35708 RepID=A0A0A9G685_ARUDO